MILVFRTVQQLQNKIFSTLKKEVLRYSKLFLNELGMTQIMERWKQANGYTVTETNVMDNAFVRFHL